jgi:hypothetical protein
MLVVQYGQILKEWDSCVISGRWRLVQRDELYDVQADPGQQNNVAAQHPDVVKQMRAHYEKWWAGVEPTLADFCPISLGASQENPVMLSCSDWLEIYCDNVNSVLSGIGGARGGRGRGGETDGEYEIAGALAVERSLPLNAPCEKMTIAAAQVRPSIARARLALARRSDSEDVADASPPSSGETTRGKARAG